MEISEDLLTQCMHCGLCLPVCPTYALTGLERSSPRGRIRLMKSVMDGTLPLTDTFASEMNFCLDCQACETACPAGVKYGELVESARVLVEKKKMFSLKVFILRNFVERKGVLTFLSGVLRFYQTSGVEKVVLSVLKRVSPGIYRRAGLLPRISRDRSFDTLPEITEPAGQSRGTVAVLTGCVMDVFFADVNRDTVEVLARNSWRVVVPHDQVCCGSLNAHNGDMESTKPLARRNIEAFEKSGAEYYVINSSGCSAFMKQYAELLKDDPDYSERASRFSAKVMDFSEFLGRVGFVDPGLRTGKRTTYHDPCHLVHTQKISAEPREIVKTISGSDFCELKESTWCCGSAGIYNVLRPDDASRLLERKMERIKESGAELVITGNPGCMAQIDTGIRKENLDIEVLHPATILKRLYRGNRD